MNSGRNPFLAISILRYYSYIIIIKTIGGKNEKIAYWNFDCHVSFQFSLY